MEFYSGIKPNLINNDILESIEKITNFKDKDTQFGGESFYESTIKPNMFAFILVGLFILFLAYKYYEKKNSSNDYEEEDEIEDFDEDIDNVFGSNNGSDESEIVIQPESVQFLRQTFNPSQTIHTQTSNINYLPDNVPVQINGVATSYDNLNPHYIPDINMPPIYPPRQDRDRYTGWYNTYATAQDTSINNPLGFPNDFNTSTANAVGNMSCHNKNMIDETAKIMYPNEPSQHDTNYMHTYYPF
jgi:hypothetical protein